MDIIFSNMNINSAENEKKYMISVKRALFKQDLNDLAKNNLCKFSEFGSVFFSCCIVASFQEIMYLHQLIIRKNTECDENKWCTG